MVIALANARCELVCSLLLSVDSKQSLGSGSLVIFFFFFFFGNCDGCLQIWCYNTSFNKRKLLLPFWHMKNSTISEGEKNRVEYELALNLNVLGNHTKWNKAKLLIVEQTLVKKKKTLVEPRHYVRRTLLLPDGIRQTYLLHKI